MKARRLADQSEQLVEVVRQVVLVELERGLLASPVEQDPLEAALDRIDDEEQRRVAQLGAVESGILVAPEGSLELLGASARRLSSAPVPRSGSSARQGSR
ncbi:hypothetical protein WME75_16985 [Sorangium sp. So ce1014]|uniref:hypothetical protein n=1 Tax=Sorangium sp. So ce1014 TaxID=3133326 RepID=UPI003F643A55